MEFRIIHFNWMDGWMDGGVIRFYFGRRRFRNKGCSLKSNILVIFVIDKGDFLFFSIVVILFGFIWIKKNTYLHILYKR